MSARTPGEEEPMPRMTPRWQIVEHVPLPPGRALPAPDAASRPRGSDDVEVDEVEGVCDATELMADDARSPEEGDPQPAAPPPGRQSSRSQLLVDLDQFLSSVTEAQRGAQPAEAPPEHLAPPGQRSAQRKTRRARVIPLLVVALLVAIVVVALLIVSAHSPHLALSLLLG